MENVEKLLRGLSSIAQGFGVAVERGAMPIEAVREIMLAVVRRAKMGTAVEDAIEKMQAPKPPADPEAGKAQAQQAIEQIKAQATAAHNQQLIALEREKAKISAQVEQAKQESQAQQNAHQNQLEAQRQQMQADIDARLEIQRAQSDERMAEADRQIQILLAHMNNTAKVEVAEISAMTTLQSSQIAAAHQGTEE